MNRDTKKQRRPYSVEDFCFFVDRSANRPEERAAAAFMLLANSGKMPPWALGFFADFKGTEPSKQELSRAVMLHPQFVLLAPVEIDGGFEGTMLAEHAVSDKQIHVDYMDKKWLVRVPEFQDYVTAKNGVQVDLILPPSPAQA